MKENEIVIWHEMDGVGDTSLQFIEEICLELKQKKGMEFKFVKMNITAFLERLKNLEKEEEKPDIIFIAQDMVSLEKADLSEVPNKFSEYMEPKIWDSMKYKGIQRGVPYLQGNHAVMFYNKKYFQNAPDSWERIIKFEKENVCNFSIDLDIAYWLMPFIYTLYGNPISEGKVTITTENTTIVQKFISELIEKGKLCSYSAISTMLEKFIHGEIACMINGEWLYEYLEREMKEDIGICILPKLNGIEMKGISSSVGLAFPANSLHGEKGEMIEIFIHSMLSEKNQEKWLAKHKRIPVNNKLLQNIKNISDDSNIMEEYRQMKKNYFMVNEECINELWNRGEEILENIVNRKHD